MIGFLLDIIDNKYHQKYKYIIYFINIHLIEFLTICKEFIPNISKEYYFNFFRAYIWYIDSIILSFSDSYEKFVQNKRLNVIFALLYSFVDNMMDDDTIDINEKCSIATRLKVLLSMRDSSLLNRYNIYENLIYHLLQFKEVHINKECINLYIIFIIFKKKQ